MIERDPDTFLSLLATLIGGIWIGTQLPYWWRVAAPWRQTVVTWWRSRITRATYHHPDGSLRHHPRKDGEP